MFTSRFTILALLTFLAGANAGCATCQNTLEVNGVATYTLVSYYVKSDNGFTECSYVDKKGDQVTCEYTNVGLLEDGDSTCPQWSRMDGYGC
ncbi:hypothetical protein DEU56DRAFT_792571 [Suillus clintonianus]|uniref:uncharacterized protein n=1 Tax=Suillus clintonianus TaxID=1904413 RepID=UPI001B86B4CA|nr:uncharacterized protein DEU56DRAFT_792571 [Suillus clintonianus]KAG2142929.1 hypothetical protein DEU56DRAFT_792571 [Suillus clintonianus]